jgi:hypothetical protein
MNNGQFEKFVRGIKFDDSPDPKHRDRLEQNLLAAMAKQTRQKQEPLKIWRIIMKGKIRKLATAAVIVAAIMLGMYALTGSGTSITMAQVRQAMEEIDWVQIVTRAEDSVSPCWYSLASKVQILCDSKGRIVYRDFKTRKQLLWNPGSKYIYESPIDEGREFAGGVSTPYHGVEKVFSSLNAKHGGKVAKKLGTYRGQEVEIWTARLVKEKAGSTQTEIFTVYIDVDRKLPVAATDEVEGPDGDIRLRGHAELKYPETGPADIYEAGAPKSAKIRPSPEP